jgi:hypothetical protein
VIGRHTNTCVKSCDGHADPGAEPASSPTRRRNRRRRSGGEKIFFFPDSVINTFCSVGQSEFPMSYEKATTPYIVDDRIMLSRAHANTITITHVIQPGTKTFPFYAGCYSPEAMPCCAILPCCMDPKYIVKEVETSKYIYVRENSIEWNSPKKVTKEGNCCGDSLCLYRAQDDIKVLYFDDPMFNNINNRTRPCNTCQTFLCGGEGERVQFDSKFCFDCCYRAYPPLFCVPCCCYPCCRMAVIRHEIWVENAEDAIRDIKQARDNARSRMQISV